MELAKIEVNLLGGSPMATHNYPCPVCRDKHAVLQMNVGRFQPCRACMAQGWGVVRLPLWLWHALGWFFSEIQHRN